MFQYVIRRSLTAKAFTELLQLLSIHIPPKAKVASSVYMVKKLFLKLFPCAQGNQHRYCSHCHQLLSSEQPCSNQLCVDKPVESFISVPIAPQLKAKLEGKQCKCNSALWLFMQLMLTIHFNDCHADPQIWQALKDRLSEVRDADTIKDVYDGSMYKINVNSNSFQSRKNCQGCQIQMEWRCLGPHKSHYGQYS